MKKYLKGALHLHTNVSDGNADPQTAAEKYKSLGYDFLVFTDHNKNFDPKDYVKKPIDDFICFPGCENEFMFMNHFKNNANAHIIGIDYLGKFNNPPYTNPSETFDNYIKETYRLGGIPQVNHPNWGGSREGYSFNYNELLGINSPFLMEIFNYSIAGYNEGNAAFESVEYIWDVLLSNGKTVYGTMTDDTHMYFGQEWVEEELLNTRLGRTRDMIREIMKGHLPGNGFVMVRAEKDPKSIKEAIKCGDFYASNGLYIDNYESDEKCIKVSLKEQDEENNRIIFKGRMGIPLKIVNGNEATYEFKNIPDEEYVRVKVINGGSKCALFQPIFRDGRKNRLEL